MARTLSDEEVAQVRAVIASGNRIEAIKQYRQLTSAGLAEAKSAVAAIETGRSIGAATMAAASNDQIEEIQAAVFASNKIKAIKLYRAATGEGLKESKDFIDALENELRRTEPGKYTGPAAKGLRHGGSRGRVSWGLRWLCCRWPMKPRSIDARPQK